MVFTWMLTVILLAGAKSQEIFTPPASTGVPVTTAPESTTLQVVNLNIPTSTFRPFFITDAISSTLLPPTIVSINNESVTSVNIQPKILPAQDVNVVTTTSVFGDGTPTVQFNPQTVAQSQFPILFTETTPSTTTPSTTTTTTTPPPPTTTTVETTTTTVTTTTTTIPTTVVTVPVTPETTPPTVPTTPSTTPSTTTPIPTTTQPPIPFINSESTSVSSSTHDPVTLVELSTSTSTSNVTGIPPILSVSQFSSSSTGLPLPIG